MAIDRSRCYVCGKVSRSDNVSHGTTRARPGTNLQVARIVWTGRQTSRSGLTGVERRKDQSARRRSAVA